MDKMKLRNFSWENDHFLRLLMVGLKLKIFSSEVGQFERLLMFEIKLKIVFFRRRPFLAVINGQNRVESFFIKQQHSANQIDQKRVI